MSLMAEAWEVQQSEGPRLPGVKCALLCAVQHQDESCTSLCPIPFVHKAGPKRAPALKPCQGHVQSSPPHQRKGARPQRWCLPLPVAVPVKQQNVVSVCWKP